MSQPIDTATEMTQATVNEWICANADVLRQRLSLDNRFDEDAFQEAYLTLNRDFSEPQTADTLQRAFFEAYRKVCSKALYDAYTMVHPDGVFFEMLSSEGSDVHDEAEDKDLSPMIRKVQRHIRSAFPRKEVIAFEMKIRGFSCRDITDTIGIGTAAINSAVARIVANTRLKFALAAL